MGHYDAGITHYDIRSCYVHDCVYMHVHFHFRYDLNVEARDEGIPPRIGIARLLIIVQDINDNSPRFQQSFYDASIPEG